MFTTIWLLIKALVWAIRQSVIHWRTSLTVVAVLAWWHWWGALSLVLTVGVVMVGLLVWWLVALGSFDPWVGRHLRAWWLRWTLYAPKLHACGLSVTDHALPVVVTVTLVGRRKIHRDRPQAQARVPTILEVRSGASWDEVRVLLVPGQKPEGFDEVARALACVRGVLRCQLRRLTPNVVSIDFQRRNLLADPVPCPELAIMAAVESGSVDLRQIFSGRTECW